MAYIQKSTPPPNKVMTFGLRNFTGGMNNRANDLQPHEAHRLLNMSFSEDEIMEKRHGIDFYNNTIYGEPITWIDEYMPYTDANKLIVGTGTKMYVDGIMVQELSSNMNGVNFDGKYFFNDGRRMFVYGTFPQVESLPYTSIIGDVNPNYIVMQIIDSTLGYTPLDSTHTRGVMVYDYIHNYVNYNPCQNEVEDVYKGVNVVPVKSKYSVVHDGRLYVSGLDKDDDNVFISDARNPYYFPVSLPIQLPPNSDCVVGLSVYDESVVVGRRKDIFFIEGMTNNPTLGLPLFRLKRLNTHTGFANHLGINRVHNYLFFVGNDGVMYSISTVRGDEKALSTMVISNQLDLFQEPFSFTNEEIRSAVSIFYKDEWYVSIQDKVFVYNYRNRAWTLYEGMNARIFYALNDELIWGGVNGRLNHFTDEYLDYGKPYRAYWTSKMFDMNDSNAYKQFREFFIVAHTFEEFASDVRITFEVDYTDVRNNVLIQNQIARWGKSHFGDRFITRNINASTPFVIGRRGRNLRFTFENGYVTGFSPVETSEELASYPNKTNNMVVWVNTESCYYTWNGMEWIKLEEADLNQPMKVYQINGEYEYRGKR